jgi:hypothetical protein
MIALMKSNKLESFGFSYNRNSVHASRTIMLDELQALINYAPDVDSKDNYIRAIEEDNCLGKRSVKTRQLTTRHLIELYTIDPKVVLYRALLYFWKRDEAARPMLAILMACTRDALLRASSNIIMDTIEGHLLRRETMEEFIDNIETGRYSKATLKSTAQNINSSWTKSGHLSGRAKKIRSQAVATPGALAFALFIGYLQDVRGTELFETVYVKVLDCTRERAIELAEIASMRGWIVFKRIGNVMEVSFPTLLNEQEVDLLREQN